MSLKRALPAEEAEQSTRNVRSRPATDKDSAGGDGKQKTKAALMSLPAELRVVIYEYALIEDDRIMINANLRPPALLSTSRQIRHEASEVWYYQNNSVFEIDNCDASLVIKFQNHIITTGLNQHKIEGEFEIFIDTEKSWPKLMEWCKRIYEVRCMHPLRNSDGDGPYYKVVAAACEIASNCNKENASWEFYQVALGALRHAIGGLDPAWLNDD